MDFNKIEFEASYGLLSQMPASDLPEIAFCGRSNVGKSSMLNKIFNRKSLARVSSVPGKTQTINFFRLGELRFADLPGYGYAKVAKTEKQRWAKLMEGYFTSGRRLRLVFQLVDMRHPPTKDDLTMMDFLQSCEIPYAVVLTKSDKLNKTETAQRLEAFAAELPCDETVPVIPFSAKTGAGVERIHELIEASGRD